MFTGIVQSIGEIDAVAAQEGDVEMQIAAPGLGLETVAIGDSISVNGCCLTVTRLLEHAFIADVSHETLNVTTLADWNVGTFVNLEKALSAGQPLGGHYVTGHVDGVGTITQLEQDARSTRMQIDVAPPLARYIAKKGSVTIDGVSLTVNEVGATSFSVNLIPHTLDVTIMNRYSVGTRVNVEVDIIARYLERLTQQQLAAE
jgi:riboflavin synthase